MVGEREKSAEGQRDIFGTGGLTVEQIYRSQYSKVATQPSLSTIIGVDVVINIWLFRRNALRIQLFRFQNDRGICYSGRPSYVKSNTSLISGPP